MRTRKTPFESLSFQTETLVHILYHSENTEAGYESSVREILSGSHHQGNLSTFVLLEHAEYGLFQLITTRSSLTSSNTVDDAVKITDHFLASGKRDVSLLFNAAKEGFEQFQDVKAASTLVVLAKHDVNSLHRFGLLPSQQEAISATYSTPQNSEKYLGTQKSNAVFRGYHLCCIMLGITTILFFISLAIRRFTIAYSPDALHSWTQYRTEGSIGPRYQLSIDASNASSWSAYAQDPSLWTLRIDDQAIIPIHELDDEEKHYQEWIQRRYPEMDQIRLNGSYLNETWLSSPAVNEVPTDELFHFAHCVLAVKRYVKAKDTGRHVCGRDIDREHVQHCLDALDWWAFPEGRRGEDLPNSNRTFWWRTKVCFD
jgi:hypothetical protein